jgi:hypothetical protein
MSEHARNAPRICAIMYLNFHCIVANSCRGQRCLPKSFHFRKPFEDDEADRDGWVDVSTRCSAANYQCKNDTCGEPQANLQDSWTDIGIRKVIAEGIDA